MSAIRIYGDHVAILFLENNLPPEGKNELVVWSWRTGVQILVVSIIYAYLTVGSPTGSR